MNQNHNSQKRRSKNKPARSEHDIFRDWYVKNDKFVLDILLSLLSDFNRSYPYAYGKTDYAKDVETLKKRFTSEGISFAAKTLSVLKDGLLAHLSGFTAIYPGFKLQPGRKYPAFMRRIFHIAYNEKHKHHVEGVRFIYQFGAAFTKIKGPARKQDEISLYMSLVLTDQSLPPLPQENSVDGQILDNAREIIKSIFKDFDIDGDPRIFNTYPKPGPGSTNDQCDKHLRFRPRVMYPQIDNCLPYERWFYPLPSFVFVEDGFKNINQFMQMWARGESCKPWSRFKPVPKKYGKLRGICMEVNEMQVAQQLVKNGLVQWIETHPITKGYVNFSDQGVNQTKALEGSFSGRKATLDEKEASDCVPRTHVGYVFQDNHRLCEVLLGLSTRTIVYCDKPGDPPILPPLEPKKYAPMGSALCFPVLALYNFSLIKGICRYYADLFRDESYASEPVYVYGDDIIVPDRIVGLVLKHLPAFGLKINKDKSFYTGFFRESCGIHAYKGVDITPVYFKYTPNSKNVESLISAISGEFQLFRINRYENTGRCLRQWIQMSTGPLPFVRETSSVIGFVRPQVDGKLQLRVNCKTTRWNAELQCYQGRLRVACPIQGKEPPFSETDGYLRSLVTGAKNPGEPGPYQRANVKGRFQRHKIQWKWVNESSL